MNTFATLGKLFCVPQGVEGPADAFAIAVSEPEEDDTVQMVLVERATEGDDSKSIPLPAGVLPFPCRVRLQKRFFCSRRDLSEAVGDVGTAFTASMLRALTLSDAKRTYLATHDPRCAPPFVAGESRIQYGGRVFDESEIVNLTDAALEFWLTYGRYSKAFEKNFAEYLGIAHVLLVNSGSSANLAAFMALTSPLLGDRQVHPGDEVITLAAGFPTTVAPILQYGAAPVFVDVEIETANVDVAQLDAALTPKTKAVMLAHTLGNPFNLDAVKEFCSANNLWLIEDNCDALGARYRGRLTGTWGDIGTSSFYPAHHITMGEGGAVYTGNPLLGKILLSLRDWGRDCRCESGQDGACGQRFSSQHGELPAGYDHKYVYSHLGYNLRPTDLQAAVGSAQLQKLPHFIARRRENHQFLYEGMRDMGEVFQLPQATAQSEPSWFGFLLTLRPERGLSRNALVQYLEAQKIQTRHLFGGNLTRQPCFGHLHEGRHYRIVGDLANTNRIMNDSFWIGVYPGLDKDRLEYMVSQIHTCVEKISASSGGKRSASDAARL